MTINQSGWFLDGVEIDEPPENAVGFVYLITRIDTGRKYIGKKLLTFRRTKTIKGVKKKVITESDWRCYYGQNKTLQAEVAELGSHVFRREILKFCYQKTECNYEETRFILEERALFQDDYYNEWVQFRATKKHISSGMKKNIF